MKVSTDACIQGGWTPIEEHVKRVLDIGTGTGLLSLMLAQRNKDIIIDAIELDEHASRQAEENIANSLWAERINVVQADVRDYVFSEKYDLIICNPPFFRNSLLGDSEERNNARHALTLSYEDILRVFENVLSKTGYASVLLPIAEYEIWKVLLRKRGWFIAEELFVQPRENMNVNRVVGLCSRGAKDVVQEKLVIYEEGNKYTVAAARLLSPFYLNL
jgi:tRNA1Val (adenine37-N6)-methyltransferase